MIAFRTSLALVFLAASAMPTLSQSQDLAAPVYEVTGDVELFPAGSAAPVKDASKAVVWLAPIDPSRTTQPESDKPHYRMLQHNKKFEPEFLVIPVGSIVDFPNLDPWFHNVFSLYQGKRFDLGLYQAGAQKSVSFDKLGASFLFCNIHPEMIAVILTVDSDFFGVSDKAGHISIAGVPSGKYVLHVWHERAAPEALKALERPVVIDGGNRTFAAIPVPVKKQDRIEHKNKYNHDYDPNSLSPEY